MPAPKLLLGDNFKVGPPAFSFEGNENTKHSGTQSFEYIVTPLKAGLIDIPEVSFSFFNPEEEKYYTPRQIHIASGLIQEKNGLLQIGLDPMKSLNLQKIYPRFISE